MTIGQITSLLRGVIKQHDRTERTYTDQKLWQLFRIEASDILSKKFKSFSQPSKRNYQTFCIELVDGVSHQCGCITQGCNVKVSVHEIPATVCGRNHCNLKVFKLDGQNIDPIREEDYEDTLLEDSMKNTPFYSLVNNKLILWNITTNLQVVQVRGPWEDITDWDDIQFCPEEETGVNCTDVYSVDIGVELPIVKAAIPGILNLLGFTLELREDKTNNSSEDA
jgi:hypothetical protein